MTDKEINEQIDKLKLNSKEQLIDAAFQLLIDNQLTPNDLKKILDNFNYNVAGDLFLKPIDEIKRYHQHVKREIYFTQNGPIQYDKQIFNKPYFYEMANLAKKNKHITEAFIRYLKDIDDLALTILGMKKIKVKNLAFASIHENWLSFVDQTKRTSLYDFYIGIMNMTPSSKKEQLLLEFKAFMKKDTGFKLDLDEPFVKFVFEMEYVLSFFSPRLANTIKIKFLVYKPEYLEDNEYNNTLENGRILINRNRADLKPKFINQMIKYYIQHEDILDSFNDNGYRAIYYSIVGDGV